METNFPVLDGGVCSLDTNFLESFRPTTFENTYNIRFWHERSARYGKPNDIQLLIEGSDEEGKDYLRGLLASSITIFAVAFCWCCLLWAFKCGGPKRFGWVSGHSVPLPAKPKATDYDNTGGVNDPEFQKVTDEWDARMSKERKRRTIMRWVVTFSGLAIVANAIMLSVKGVDSLIQTLDGVDSTIAIVQNILDGGVNLIDEIVKDQNVTAAETEDILELVNGMCPEVRDPICTITSDPDSCNFEGIAEDGEGMLGFIAYAADATLTVYEELMKSRADLVDLLEVTNNMNDLSENFNWAFWCAMTFSLALAIICLFFVYAAFRPLSKWSRRIQNWAMVPIFAIMVALSWILSMVFVIGSVGLADMCYNSPDENFQSLLNTLRSNFSPLIFNAIVFYTSGCPVGLSNGGDIVEFITILEGTVKIIAAAQELIDTGINPLCDEQARAEVVVVTQTLSTSFCSTMSALRELRLWLQCSNWFPLYDESMYNAMCYDGTDGFAWVTATQIAIAFLSLFMVTFRIVYYDIEIEDGDGDRVANLKDEDDLLLEESAQGYDEDGHDNVTTPEVAIVDSYEGVSDADPHIMTTPEITEHEVSNADPQGDSFGTNPDVPSSPTDARLD